MSRLALGTAQFGLTYGVANRLGRPSESEVREILALARRAGIDTLDTAIAYGDSEQRLGAVGVADWRIVSKVPAMPSGVADPVSWLKEQVAESLRRLHAAQLEAVLLHSATDAWGPAGGSILAGLRELKDAGLVRAIGVSIYDPEHLERIWPVWVPDIVQAPCNVLDRRLLSSGWLERLVDAGVRVHTRSVFLQGLLLMDPGERPATFAPWQPLLTRWFDWCASQGHAPLSAALNFVYAQRQIERVVVGVDSAAQLGQILEAFAQPCALPPADLSTDDRELLEPFRWTVK